MSHLSQNIFCEWSLPRFPQQGLQTSGWMHQASDASEHCVSLAVVLLLMWFSSHGSFVNTASPVSPCRQPWAWQCMVITTSAQSAGMQEPNKQNRQIAKGICRALDMIWMQHVFSISHSSDSWDFFFFSSGWKGESRLHSAWLCVHDSASLCI